MKPTLFIGSSSESLSLDIAYAAQENLEDCAQPVVWNQGWFEISKFALESLLDSLDEAEFGLFVFAPDDLIRIRGEEMKAARDNVIFELGLFVGRLGHRRSFVLVPKGAGELRLPSDLLGLNLAMFTVPENPDMLVGALGPACNKIRRAIKAAAAENPPAAPKDGGEATLALSLAIPEPQRKHLANLAQSKTQNYQGRGSLRSELRHLVSVGLLEKLPGKHIGDMKSGSTYNLAEFVKLTDTGRDLVERLKLTNSHT